MTPIDVAQAGVSCAVLCFASWTFLRIGRWFFERRYGRDED
jgi:hypothetical protein